MYNICAGSNIISLVARFGNGITSVEPIGLQFFQVLGIEIVISILQKPVDQNRILIEELGKLSLQS